MTPGEGFVLGVLALAALVTFVVFLVAYTGGPNGKGDR